MKWCLTTCIYNSPDLYTDRILPLTEPLFLDYCRRWDMDYRPFRASRDEVAQHGLHIPTLGTEIVYASIPFRHDLLSAYEGVVYLDEDAVIIDPTQDIRRTVTEDAPIGMVRRVNGAVQVLRSGHVAQRFLENVWAMRTTYGRLHWAEEGAMKELLGRNPIYPGDNQPDDETQQETAWTPYWSVLDEGWNWHPLSPEPEDGIKIMQPGGIHPFTRRLEMITNAIC